ncbi:MAG: DMT family transporter, partial [Bacteroidia bacterium]|nr:DMT family transporter [Bacteroidia bacterium]
MLCASIAFACMGAFVKSLTKQFHELEIVFFRNAFGLCWVGLDLFRNPPQQTSGNLLLLIRRGIFGFLAITFFFYTIHHSSLAVATTFSKSEIIFTAIIATIQLGEPLTWLGGFSIIIGLFGVGILSGFQFNQVNGLSWIGIFCGLFAALAHTTVRKLRNSYDPRIVMSALMLTGTVLSVLIFGLKPWVSWDWLPEFRVPIGHEWWRLLGMSLAGAIGQYFLTTGYFQIPAALASTVGL